MIIIIKSIMLRQVQHSEPEHQSSSRHGQLARKLRKKKKITREVDIVVISEESRSTTERHRDRLSQNHLLAEHSVGQLTRRRRSRRALPCERCYWPARARAPAQVLEGMMTHD